MYQKLSLGLDQDAAPAGRYDRILKRLSGLVGRAAGKMYEWSVEKSGEKRFCDNPEYDFSSNRTDCYLRMRNDSPVLFT